MSSERCPTCGRPLDDETDLDLARAARHLADLAERLDLEPDPEPRAGPWKSGYGEYPFADEVYDLTHEREPDPGDPYDQYGPDDDDDEPAR
jgi:hypothetical protein